jgi:hypothetical protein
MPISEKSLKIKFIKKFQKILYKFLCQKWGRETPGRHQVGLPRHLTHRWRGPALAAPPRCERAPLAPHSSLLPLLFLSPKNNDTLSSNSCSSCASPGFFDLLAQPNISAEIWIICSPVCDSSTCPNRISFSEVFLEYFSIVGDSINEYACLFYCLELIF